MEPVGYRGMILVCAARVALLAAACNERPVPPDAHVALEGGTRARVESTTISPALVESVALAKGARASEAAADLVDDELLARGARWHGLEHDPAVQWSMTADLAGRTARRMLDAARALGPPSEDELATRRVVHAIVVRSPSVAPEDAHSLAAAIERAVVHAPSPEEFERRASRVPHEFARVVVERIGPFGPDGKTASGEGLDATFVTAAFSLHTPGDTSPIVETRFGWHVIRLVDRLPVDPSAVADRRRELDSAVLELRARSALGALLRARRDRTSVRIEGAADALMADSTRGP
jgi:hypothetical protein